MICTAINAKCGVIARSVVEVCKLICLVGDHPELGQDSGSLLKRLSKLLKNQKKIHEITRSSTKQFHSRAVRVLSWTVIHSTKGTSLFHLVCFSDDEKERVLEDLLERLQELRAGSAVNNAVIA